MRKPPTRKCPPCSKCGQTDPTQFYSTSSWCKACHKQAVYSGRLRKIGLTLADRDSMTAAQGNRCAICGDHGSLFARALHLDHDHGRGTPRALLCGRCNQLLGKAGDSAQLLRAAADYLDKHSLP